MRITCNGEAVDLDGQVEGTVAGLLLRRFDEPHPPGIAVAVGGEVVPRTCWGDWPIRDGDVVEIVTAVQGG